MVNNQLKDKKYDDFFQKPSYFFNLTSTFLN
jgi:hypothetical protein